MSNFQLEQTAGAPVVAGTPITHIRWRQPTIWAIAITLFAFGLRVWSLEQVPPGWRDDELIETLVISQKILDGELAFYYPDASGHEALYHALNAVFLAWFGPTGPGIRLLSAFIGTLTVAITYALTRRMFGAATGLTAAALLAVSFWGLMYSRVGIRHSLTPLLATLAFFFFWRATGFVNQPSGQKASSPGNGTDKIGPVRVPRSLRYFVLSGLFFGLGFHSYFASRGALLIPVAFLIYVVLLEPARIKARWRGILVLFATTLVVALPLALAVAAQPEAEGRISELALPVIEAQQGNFDLIVRHAVAALAMPHRGGDPEWLYNIPERPVFGPAGALFFWSGVLLASWWAIRPFVNRILRKPARLPSTRGYASAFLLIWWMVGITPAVLSLPPASLGHVILAQPAFYILAALPVGALAGWERLSSAARFPATVAVAMILISLTTVRDTTSYFVDWPQRGMVRFLYHADVEDVASFVLRQNESPSPADFGITGLLAGPWNRIALDLALQDTPGVRPRWYNPERALLLRPNISFSGYPVVETPFSEFFKELPDNSRLTGAYQFTRVEVPTPIALTGGRVFLPEAPVCFVNHLCWTAAGYDAASGSLELHWQADDRLDLPPMPLISNPPPPGVYAGPRLFVFAHLVDEEGNLLTGDDGLWVDPLTIRAGDAFLQRHNLASPSGSVPAAVLFGLYDPMTGARILTTDGRDSIRLELVVE